MPLVYLVRHAESAADPSVPPQDWLLTDEGRRRAARLAARSEWKTVAAVASSAEPKARLTAEAIAKRWGKPLVDDSRFNEIARPWADSSREFEDTVADYLNGRPVPGWERATDAARRFGRALADLRDGHQGDVAVVSHGTVMSIYVSRALGIRVRPAAWAAIGTPDVCVVDPELGRVLRDWGKTRF
jgi:broad specificity phosphatase PhoE